MEMENKKVLICDDSQVTREELKDICKTYPQLELLEAGNGKDAIDICEREKPDMVFLDVIMPDANGIEVLKLIGGKTYVVMISALGEYMLLDEAKKFGAKDYIEKPLDRDIVLKKLQKLLS